MWANLASMNFYSPTRNFSRLIRKLYITPGWYLNRPAPSARARDAAEREFQEQLNRRASLDRLSQMFVRAFRRRLGLVYYPLWVLRYLYRGRSFQVVLDGYSGKVLYGKAPGNTIYRAAILVLSMAAGAFVAIDVSALAVYLLAIVKICRSGWPY